MTPDCIHLGIHVGETVECHACAKKTHLKLFACAVYGQCTLVKPVENVACCNGAVHSDGKIEPCPHYEPRE